MTHSYFFASIFVLAIINPWVSAQESPSWAAPELDRAVSVRDTRTGDTVPLEDLLDILAEADVVFLGEYHTDETTHRVELAVYEGLMERREGQVVLAMEMFERDVQEALDSYVSGKTTEKEFLASSRPWGNYHTSYRPLIEFAKSAGAPVVGSNFPRTLRRRLAMMGKDTALEDLEEGERKFTPKELFANTPAYWRRVDNAVRGHIGMMGNTEGDDERLYSTQSLWDNAMGEACAIALDEHAGSSVLHVNGGFHSAYGDGTARQLRLRKPSAKVLTVTVVPTTNPSVADLRGLPSADYVVYAETRATDVNEGKHSVYVQSEVDYRLHLPANIEEGTKVPLLIWFSDNGMKSEDGIALWRGRLGSECAIAALEAPYREIQEDLVEGGRWFWPDSFMSDIGSLHEATSKMWGYILRHYPIDPNFVCIAGEGTGATVVSAVSLLSGDMSATSFAFAPKHYSKLKDISLPLPELMGDDVSAEKALNVFAKPVDEAWWEGELKEYSRIGLQNTLALISEDSWKYDFDQENAIRSALGMKVNESIPTGRRHIVAAAGRSHQWARLMAVALSNDESLVAVLGIAPDNDSVLIPTDVNPESLKDGKGLPPCPGSFGGTTIVVLPEWRKPEALDAWLSLEKDDPLTKMNRFQRLRVATTKGDLALPNVIEKLRGENRMNILIVPGAFCAEPSMMRQLRGSVSEFEDSMTIQWLPGLGKAMADSLTQTHPHAVK